MYNIQKLKISLKNKLYFKNQYTYCLFDLSLSVAVRGSLTFSTLLFRGKMSLFGTTSSFGSSGTSMFGSTTTDNHNPMKVL